jgi:hypothetical protein
MEWNLYLRVEEEVEVVVLNRWKQTRVPRQL